MRPRTHLPSGPLKRFRLPRAVSTEPLPKRARLLGPWTLLPFALFGLLTYWLAVGRPLPDFRSWFEGPPRPDGAHASETPAPHPALPTAAEVGSVVPKTVVPRAAEAKAATAAPVAEAPPKPRRKPPLALNRHRLRPVLEWEDAERNPSSAKTSQR